MHRPLVRNMRGTSLDVYIDGYIKNDFGCLSPYQIESINRLSVSIQLEQDVYLLEHPEVSAMLNVILGKLSHKEQNDHMLKDFAFHYVRSESDLDEEIRKVLKLPSDGPYQTEPKKKDLEKANLYADLINILLKHYPPNKFNIYTPESSMPNTLSSSFISCLTSATTPSTPEPEPEPEQTMSQIIFNMVSNTLDKAIFLKVTDDVIKYDVAYVELMKAVEEAMEIPVKEIRQDIYNLYQSAYKAFEYNIMAKEKIQAEIAWDNRMRKKLKRLLRRQKNFKGYETPPSSSELSSHPSYKIPPQRPCVCHPKWTFNRYPKDRYGIYIASVKQFNDYSITACPNINEIECCIDQKKCGNNNHEVDPTLT